MSLLSESVNSFLRQQSFKLNGATLFEFKVAYFGAYSGS